MQKDLKKMSKSELIALLNELKNSAAAKKQQYKRQTVVLNNGLQEKRDVSLNVRDVDFECIDKLFQRLNVERVFRYNLTAAFIAAVKTLLETADTNTFNVFVSEFKNTNKVFLNRIHKNRRQHEELLLTQQLIEE